MPVLTKINRGSLATGVVGTAELADGTIAAVDLATGAALANLADDSITIAKMGTMMSVGETAPTSPAPFIGQQWYRASTGVTYQYTNDGTSSFWLDVSSGGIGTSASKSVDFAGDIDTHKSSATVAGGLVVGSVYYNRVKNKHFICTTATDNANVWAGRYDGWGGTVTEYSNGGTNYRAHTFLSSGTFIADTAISVDYLVVAGGGGGGRGEEATGGDGGGGGGAGGLRTATGLSVAKGSYSVTVGDGGIGAQLLTVKGTSGGNSIFSSITSIGGGGGGTDASTLDDGLTGGSGGGASGYDAGGIGGVASTSPAGQGNAGGAIVDKSGNISGAGGGGSSAVGGTATTGSAGGNGGAGTANSYILGTGVAAVTYAGGGGGGGGNTSAFAGGTGGTGGGGDGGDTARGQLEGEDGTVNTGGGGGGGDGYTNLFHRGGSGGSGIVVIRYAIS